jgi:hypothetical protein
VKECCEESAMQDSESGADEDAIRAIIARQFASLSWANGRPPAWHDLAGDFHAGASLFPAARPAKPIGVADFVERMRRLSETTLKTFEETVLGLDIRVFGTIAMAAVAGEMTENRTETSRSVEMLLLVKSEERWKIVAQAWDKASNANPLPDNFLAGGTSP